MDLSVLHPVKSPARDYTMKDKLNRITSPLGCRFLEWSGWYNQEISQRLLGHYRLYQLFKAKHKTDFQLSLPVAYIFRYRTLHLLKYWLSCIMAALYYIFTLGGRYYPLSVEELNKQLINNQFTVLQEFLTNADIDFEIALHDAINQVNGAGNKVITEITFVQNRLEHKVYNNTCHYFTEYNGTVNSSSNELKGKQTGVLSKKQILILFDLLAEKGSIERIDFTKPNKFESVAELLQALNGKSISTWLEELNNYKGKGLYYYSDNGGLKQLISTLTNLSDKLRKSGFRILANEADKRIRELENNQKS
jgi:hypothetical protein